MNTKHTCNDGAGPHFGRKTAGCPRCDELSNGAAPRDGWQRAHFTRKLDAPRHTCTDSCGPVCTANEW